MPRVSGIPLVDLFDLTDRLNAALPQVIQDFTDRFVVTRHRTTRSPGAIIHHGELQGILTSLGEEVGEFDLGFGTLSIPLINTGVPFQLSMQRSAIADNLEPSAENWQLDLRLDRFVLALNGLEPAIYVPEAGTAPRHLLRDPAGGRVKIIGETTLRLQNRGGEFSVAFIDESDPLDPMAASGGVASLSFAPSSFFFGTSEFGMTVGKLTFDFSEDYSPPQVLERGQGPGWVGLAIAEATIYAPRNLPGIGDLSGGVRNVLIGNPLGIQGEFELQFGRTALNPSSFRFRQSDETAERGANEATGVSRTVSITAAQDEDVVIHAGLTATAPPEGGTLADWGARWFWPGQAGQTGDASSGTIRHGQVLRVIPLETVAGQARPFEHPEVSFRFVASGAGAAVRASVGAQTFDNVVHLNGRAADIAGVTLTAVSSAPPGSTFVWEVPARGLRAEGPSFSPDFGAATGVQKITLRERPATGEERLTHVRVRIEDKPTLLVGCEDGVFLSTDATTALTPARVEQTYDLSDFHGSADLNPLGAQAVVDPTLPSRLRIPGDGLAQVLIREGGAPGAALYERWLGIEMKFDSDEMLTWVQPAPLGLGVVPTLNPEAGFRNQVLEWAARYPDADFLVIGRCDDIGSDAYNLELGIDRAKKGVDLLTTPFPGVHGTLIPASRVYWRSEQSGAWTPPNADGGGAVTAIEDDPRLGMQPKDKTDAAGDPLLRGGRLIEVDIPDSQTWPDLRYPSDPALQDASREGLRAPYRRIEIYALERSGVPSDAAAIINLPPLDPVERLSMVPAAGRATAPAPVNTPAMDYRVKLKLGWDKPTAHGWSDAIPNLAEAEFAWTPAQAPLPALPNGSTADPSQEVLVIYAKWLHDEQTGFTRTTIGVKSEGDPDGLFSIPNKQLTAAMALAPALISGVDFDTDVVGSGTRVAALLGGVGIAEFIMGDASKVAMIGFEAQAQTRSIADPGAAYQLRLTTEYVCTLHIDAGELGLKTAPDRPMKIRYKNVGIEFDNTRTGWEQFQMVFETKNLEIEDPGKWQIDGALGQLLRIVEISMGTGSLWIEGRIAIALNIGILEISEAIIRLTFRDGAATPEFELRGFVLKANIPNVLEGEGRLRIEDGGMVRAGVDVMLPTLGVGGQAGLALKQETVPEPFTFLSLFLGVQFSTPIPLAQSGAALYGFKGLFTMNGTRDLAALASSDPIGRELEWWRAPPENKYKPQKGQYALGLGVVAGTMPDVSFCFSASGMVVVAFPDLEVILGVDVKVIEVPETTATDEGGAEGTITGLIVIDDESVKVAVSAQYDIPKILSLKVPFGAYFPYSLKGTYVRLGSDGVTATINGETVTRFGEPITLTLLPDVLDLSAWAYLMIEQDGLPNLGGDARFSFEGFSVGFGAGAGLEWSAGPIKLSASVKVLVGFGTAPLMIKGGLFVAGELDLVVLSISARGEIILTYYNEEVSLDGEFCGEVDLFFFSIKGCVRFRITAGNAPAIGEPDPPVVGISLTDRLDRIMGTAAPAGTALAGQPLMRFVTDAAGNTINTGVPPEQNHTVWADTAPVIHFRHRVKDGMPDGAQFNPAPGEEDPLWFGSSRQKWAYRLDNVILRRKRDGLLVSGDAALLSTWTGTPYRAPIGSGVDNPLPGEHEGVNLKLLDWDPYKWVENHADGGAGTAGDPADRIRDICETVPMPRRGCVFGRAARGVGLNRVRMRQSPPAAPPYPSKFYLTGEPAIWAGSRRLRGRPLVAFLQAAGARIRPGAVVGLPFPVSLDGVSLTEGYRMPQSETAAEGGMRSVMIPWMGTFDRRVADASVTLLICETKGRPGETGRVCFDFAGVEADGKRTSLVLDPFTFRALDPQAPFTMTDAWIVTTPSNLSRGRDGRAEVQFSDRGFEIFLNAPATQLELYFVKTTNSAIKLEALGPSGQVVDSAGVEGPQGQPLVGRLAAPDGIVRIRVTGGGGEAWLYRICRPGADAPPPAPEQKCQDFRKLKPSVRKTSKVVHEDFTIAVLNRGTSISLSDAVDQSGPVAKPGQDRSADLMFPDAGIVIVMPEPCQVVEVWVMLFGGAVEARGLDGGGAVLTSARSPRAQRVAHKLILTAKPGERIAQVHLIGGSGEAVLFKICCSDRGAPAQACITFDNLVLDTGVSGFQWQGHEFTDLSGSGALRLADDVNQNRTPARSGPDGRPEVRFAEEGLRIKLPHACSRVVIKAMTFGGVLKAEARDGLGARVDATSTPNTHKVELELRFEGPGIEVIEIFGGRGEAVIYEICCTGKPDAGDDLPVDDSLKDTPVVRSIIDDKLDTVSWRSQVRSTRRAPDGRTCRVVTFRPPRGGTLPETGFAILSPEGYEVTLLRTCGVDQVMLERRTRDEERRQAELGQLGTAATTPVNARRPIVLEPGEDYEIEIAWSWHGWETDDDSVTGPDAPEEGDWKPGSAPQRFQFRVASQVMDVTAVTPQDGLNEHVFDPRDIVRYLKRMEPENGRAVQFTDDPVWVHFDNGHVEHLLERYGRELKIEIRRSDPPAQPGGNIAPLLIPLIGVVDWMSAPADVNSTGATRINAAVAAAPCLPDAPVAGGASLRGIYDLEPRAMYDFNLVVQRAGGGERVQVAGTRFTTSRYAGPREMIAGLGYGVGSTGVHAPDEIILDAGAVIPGGPMEVSDALLNEALVALSADTLPLPTETGKTYVIWRFAAGNWQIEGILIDAPEPTRRIGAIETPTGSEIVTRLELTGARIGGAGMTVRRVTENWTRILLQPATPIRLGAGTHELELSFATPGGVLRGRRVIPAVPSILAREGLI